MWRSVATIGLWTLASRLLGFARDMLIAGLLGAGPVADAFFVALKFPNLFRRLFGEGAFNAAFVPALAGIAQTQGEPAARRFSGHVAGVMAAGLGILVVAGELSMPWLMRGFAPGFAATPARFALAVTLTRITFPYLLLVCLTALVSGVLNAAGRFAVAAATPVAFNVICIAALLGLRRVLPTPGHALAVGVAAAGVVQLAWATWACARAGLLPPTLRPRLTADVRRVLGRMGPGLLGAGVTQLNLALGIVISSLLPAGTISVLYYADRVNQLPLGVIGAAMGTALLPSLSRDHQQGNAAGARLRLNRALEIALTLALPAAIALIVMAQPIVQVLFGRGAFGPALVAASAAALMVYAAGLPASVFVRLLAPACFARGDMAGPVWAGAAAVAGNVAISLALLHRLGPLAPATGTAAAALLNAVLLWRRARVRPDSQLLARAARIVAATLVMAAVLVLAMHLLADAPHPALRLAALIALGGGSYAIAVGGWRTLSGLREMPS